MKILHIITKSELGGAQSVLTSIVNALCEEHEVTVIAGEGDGKMFNAIDDRVRKIYYPHLRRDISLYHDTKTLVAMWKFNRKLQPDIIHLHSSKAGLLGRLVFPRRKIIYTIHGFDSIRVAFRQFLPIERIMQRRCAAIVGVSQYDMNSLHSEGIFANTHLVYNGVDVPQQQPSATASFPTGYAKTVLCIARVAKPKRHDIFIECAKRLPQYAFVWIGNLDPVDNVPDNVFFLGNIPNAAAYCKQADLFVLPSNYEGLPIVILEAMCQGKAIVASKVGGISEMVIDNKNGFAVPNDSAIFAERIQYILGNDEVLQQFSDYSLQLYKNRFTNQKMVEGYLKIYTEVAKRTH
ncbi:MAG: glycosyltransferase family 4 protein [Prevotella sp.]|nr:glycosyltransferase family 4 protein [Prevotella sp.]